MKANSDKSKQSNKATRRVLAGVLCGASVLSLVLSLVMPPISQAIANDGQAAPTEGTVMGGSSSESTDVENTNNGDTENQNSDETEGDETGDDATGADQLSDDTEADGAAQPADDGEPVYKVATVANEGEVPGLKKDKDGYTLLTSDDDLSTYLDMENKPEKLRLAADISSSTPIAISQNTTIDLAGHKLYYRTGNNDTFIKVTSGALTIEDSAKPVDIPSPVGDKNTGRPASMVWDGNNNATLTYYVTTSNPKEDSLGTTETTTRHDVSSFGAIVAASKSGSVKQVISVADGSTLNLNGGMITTPRPLGNDGHVILSQGAVNISGGYVTNGNDGGWGGGLCITGANASLEMTGGVVAGNKAASGGGIFANNGAVLNLSGGVISGNATYHTVINNDDVNAGGYGGGVYTRGASVTISDSANITNNRAEAIASAGFYNKGRLGGGGIASMNGGTLSMTGGSVTANYSYEAGGGIYAGFPGQRFEFTMSSGFIAGNKSDNAEGGGLRISGGTTGVINAENASNRVYITNNKTMTGSNAARGGDWGGGGVFVQEGGTLNIVKTLITNNNAGGWGGGIGACPTGKTIVSYSKGAAIYDNADNVDQDDKPLESPHYSAGGNGKTEDSNPDYIGDPFKNHGHKDFFLVRKNDSQNTVAVVLGKMLGGESAGWQGTCDRIPVTIDPNGGAEAKYMFGLEAHPTPYAKGKAQAKATTIISGNYSYTHGGGIMTNGDLVVGEVSDLRVYPSMKLKATKALVNAKGDKQPLNGHEYKFQLLRQKVNGTKAPSWKDDGTLDMGDCSGAGEATVDQSNGSITFDSGKDYSSGQYVFYLVEEPISGQNELDIKFDKTIYKIEATVEDDASHSETLMGFTINYYKVKTVAVYKKAEDDKSFVSLGPEDYSVGYSEDKTAATVTIGGSDSQTFTNRIVPYTSSGSWIPKATKVVEGGEMKEFTLQLATDDGFQDIIRETKTTGDKKKQTLSFLDGSGKGIVYSLSDITKNPDVKGDPTGRGASKTFTYYVREKQPTTSFTNYKYDESIYKITVTATDQSDKTIKCDVTYTQIVDAKGKPIPENEQSAVPYVPDRDEATGKEQSVPVFTNTYSTSLPLSGMSGVTLTYLAGAAVLCAAAAWMHIRRKANAKGGERRE
ncbi:Spy0128 family protein [Collinsella aerofaciens]|uniref:Spy0128 family protein n=1 Tax=Collinsella aerofaciens TaxID=74426 RepID=UPI00319E43CC